MFVHTPCENYGKLLLAQKEVLLYDGNKNHGRG